MSHGGTRERESSLGSWILVCGAALALLGGSMPEVSFVPIRDNELSSSPAARVSISFLKILRVAVTFSNIATFTGSWVMMGLCSNPFQLDG